MDTRVAAVKRNFVWWGTAVLLIAAIFRLFMLHDVPPGLSQDEVLNADIVQFIRGGYHALFFREGYGHEPLYHYFSVPFQVLLGDNVLSIRLPAVTLGLLLVALALRWARREFGMRTAVLAGAGLAISWWPIVFSRVGIRPILEPVLLLLFAWFWPKRPWLAGLFLGLSL
jgi:4-amino-4-deoxy-L-arabinose transferase-like glycosyltransferase